MRALILGLVFVALAVGVLFLVQPDRAAFAEQDLARVIYLLLSILLVGSGVWGLSIRRQFDAKGPGIFTSLAIWAGLFALVVLLYHGAWFWSSIAAMIGAGASSPN